jgi:hypothetical protein
MLLDRVLRLLFRNFATLFLATALITVPLQVGYELAFHDVVAVGHLHGFIDEFPEGRQVRGVGTTDLDRYRSWGLAIALIEIALVPLLVRMTRRVLEADRDKKVPGVARAWASVLERRSRGSRPAGWSAALGAGLIVGAGVLVLGHAITGVVAEPVARDYLWAVLAVGRGVARAAAAPFLLVPLAAIAPGSPDRGRGLPTNDEFQEVSS